MKTLICILLALAFQQAIGASIRCDGVAGNSGADGKTLVRLDGTDYSRRTINKGLAFDRLGALWAFGGTDNIVRLSPDGRMLGSYPLKVTGTQGFSLVLAGDHLVIQIASKLYRLPITAESGTEPEEIPSWNVKSISLNSMGGKIGMVALVDDRRVAGTLDVAQDQFEAMGELTDEDRGNFVTLLWDGRVMIDGSFTFNAGQKREELTPRINGVHQLVGDYIYEFLWHMTVSRRDKERQPAPGVIYGGSSGYFIGSLPKDGEVHFPTGVAHLGGDRYAVAGPMGVIHLVTLNPERQTFEATRRLGAIHQNGPMALDPRGHLFFFSGYWDWSDSPAHTMRSAFGYTSRETQGMQATILSSGEIVFPCLIRGTPSMMHKPLDGPENRSSTEVRDLPKNPTALVIYPEEKAQFALVANAAGEGTVLRFGSDRRISKSEGPAEITLTNPHPAITSFGQLADGRFVAADAGAVVLLEREGKHFRETARWHSWGGKERFGPEIYLATDGEHLWVSDRANNRVIHFTLREGSPASFQVFTGEGLQTPLKEPLRIDAAAGRAAVIDWGNQRIVKLTLVP